MKFDDNTSVWQAVSAAALILLFVVLSILTFGAVLLVIGAVIALAARNLTDAIDAAMGRTAATIANPAAYVPPPTSAELIGALGPLSSGYIIVLSVIGAFVLTAFALRWFNVLKPDRAKFDLAIEGVTEWLTKAAELILLAVVFMLAAQKMPAWPIQLFSLLIIGCLAFHIIKPIGGLITGPAMSAMGRRQSIIAGAGVLLLTLTAFYLTGAILVMLGVALNGLIESGISP